jgi:hypothetical protein
MFISMNKNPVLFSFIGLFFSRCSQLSEKPFLASHIVCMRPCKTLGMGDWLLKPSYYFATSIGEAKSTCSVLGFDSHFHNFGTILFGYCRIAFIQYYKQCFPLHSSGTKGESLCSYSTEQHSCVIYCSHPVLMVACVLIRYQRRRYVLLRY